eukprot:UC1_evm1s6
MSATSSSLFSYATIATKAATSLLLVVICLLLSINNVGAAPVTGRVRVAVMLTRWSDAPEITRSIMTEFKREYGSDIHHYFDWASHGKLSVETVYFQRTLDKTEKKSDGECRDIKEMRQREDETIPGYNPADYKATVWLLLARDCVYPAGTIMGNVEMGANNWMVPRSLPYNCGPAMNTVCQTVFVHELLHAFDLAFHSGSASQCPPDKPAQEWRDCPGADYGNLFDMLGSSNHKQSYGLSYKVRSGLGWTTNADLLEIRESGTYEIASLSQGNAEKLGAPIGALVYMSGALKDNPPFSIEFRQPVGYDSIMGTKNNGDNTKGIMVAIDIHQVDMHLADNVLAADSDSGFFEPHRVALLPTDPAWTDKMTGVTLKVNGVTRRRGLSYISFDVTYAEVEPACERKHPWIAPGMFAEYIFHICKARDVTEWQGPGADGTGWIQEYPSVHTCDYAPFYERADELKIDVLNYEVMVHNRDTPSCGESALSLRPLDLPEGWYFYAGGCHNIAKPQEAVRMCITVGVPWSAPAGFTNLWLQTYHDHHRWRDENDNVVADPPSCYEEEATNAFQLGICVRGTNSEFQGIGNNRYPSFQCVTGAKRS